MIKLSKSSIQILAPDGTRYNFETEQLQEKLISCCIAAGISSPWIAEDIALSVEFSLNEISRSGVFTQAEIDSFVLKVLREVGYSEVAGHYSASISKSLQTIPVTEKYIKDSVSRYLALTGDDLNKNSKKVFLACKNLGMKEVFPTLILEIAKYFHFNQFKLETASVQMIENRKQSDSVWSVSPETLAVGITNSNSAILLEKIVTVSGISSLFPAVKINASLGALAEYHNLQKPLTELTVVPYLQPLADAVDFLADLSFSLYSENGGGGSLPVYLRFQDTISFAAEWMEGSSSSDADFIISYILEMLKTDVILRK
jgi:transcriptional regulator NrdR family protein